jgi:hypothetical protein
MKNKQMKTVIFKTVILIGFVAVLSSCLWDEEETELSSSPYFYSLKFGRNDSIPGLVGASFSLQYDTLMKDSIIVNLDSLPYNTRIDSVLPTFNFASTSSAFLTLRDSAGTGLDTMYLTGKDTVDFTRVISVTNIPQNAKTELAKTYRIKVNVHQVEPEYYHWRQLNASVFQHSGSNQWVVRFKDKFWFYVSSGPRVYLYSSADGKTWSTETLTGFTVHPTLRNIRVFNSKIYYVHEDGTFYSSSDGINWMVQPTGLVGYSPVNLLFELDDMLWSTVRNAGDNARYFAQMNSAGNWTILSKTPDNFPLSDFAALSFKSRTKKPRAVVLGGFSETELLRTVWSVEKNVFNEYKWVNFSLENTSLKNLSGAAIIHYDDKLMLYGGMDADDLVIETPFMQSKDEGLSWQAVDDENNIVVDTVLNIEYATRSYQSVIHLEDTHQVFLFGGRNRTNPAFSDVWVGKLNRLSFLRQ